MNTPYLITFTPAGPFFFGGPESFSDGFFVQSERFPQPTTVMGALRASLLMKAGLLAQHKRGRGGGRRFVPKEKTGAAIGLTGTAKLNDFEGSSDFGIIEKISPVFLVQKEGLKHSVDAFFPTPADVMKNGKTGGFRVAPHTRYKARFSNAGRPGDRAYRSEIDHKKEEHGPFVGGPSFWSAYLSGGFDPSEVIDLADEDKVRPEYPEYKEGPSPFISRSQVGIGLERRRVEGGRFYVKLEYELKRGWAFGVVAGFRKPPQLTETILLGGDQSVFHLTATPADDLPSLFDNHPILNAWLNGETALSNAGAGAKGFAASPLLLREKDALRDPRIEHAVVGGIDNVRMLNSINLKNPGAHFKDGRKVLKSDAYRVAPAGSVFFFRQGAADSTDPVFQPSNNGLAEALGYNQWLNCKP